MQNFVALEIEVKYRHRKLERQAEADALAAQARPENGEMRWSHPRCLVVAKLRSIAAPRLALTPSPTAVRRGETLKTLPRLKGTPMRLRMLRSSFLVLAAVLLMVGGVLTPRLAAQEATPGPIAPHELAPGVIAEVYAGAPSTRAPEQTVYVARFVFQPGAEIFPHNHPGTTILGVQSGSFGWTLLEGTAHIVRGAASGGTETEELTEPGTEVILEPGDAIFYEDDVVHTARGASDEEAVVLGTLVLTSGEPLLMPVEDMADMAEEATPAP